MRLVILDRDGVINEDSDDYIKTPEEWRPIPGSLEAIARLTHAGIQVVVATNQSGIARGLFNVDMLGRIHNRMLDEIHHRGGEIEAIFFCPHGPRDGCTCRKPLPGLLYDIAARFKTSLSSTFAVGDTRRDLEAARAAQALPVLVRTGKGMRTIADGKGLAGVPVYDDLAAFTDAVLSHGVSGGA
ncbi:MULTISPECIES: D-glycero-beta-D-manno-heptose 1,7-bisphosphate 7-phosphatase [Acidiferrobacter]|jgi:D-glycero-D-manno-heptose 1,7-bisphosphate phosphatase|uniref:D,D-heptose 1,7-bisphosphate phosphatase n=1 Tax=Acidiferrobacter thiooxydans TaxID=163359 RepID=A0A1C2G1Z5_9GAMM|nr:MULTISPECIES: D-glycero-beta-D-manno-heptose 1,7-bisphosphate 7-phosphatase [Acidiferrobacter]MDA8118680.1 D-glycero-beta-D-manno-heptose 1,7-bisphosphate 7-phosphatase [Gammaproteobacteria bacterium]MDA8190002.1 D-glycero-beta-D-manno-heptose 1,7-bisphosphate 7-phosphatase [Gammaproteobacteria bacterium]RCN58408.1 D-glycero-beta-D-manno-heptose-1,7-bisphosphate 7-phosphatase [Acidiferrobacter thiooxydans]UEO00008.1 D-glycero-beta-D-manno-heptose 1,7-bisphosphate 7-phosphatase [Acidiferrobac